MNKIVTYSLLIIVLFAFNCKAVSYYLHLWDNSIVLTQDSDCEKEKPESEKSDEKDEKKEFSECLIYKRNNSFVVIHKLTFDQMHNFLLTSSDFSKSLYMPPEHI